MAEEIQHHPEQGRFSTEVQGQDAHLVYRKTPEGDLEIYSTFVPPEGRGGGVARKLTEKAVAYAKEQGLKVKPTCSYVVTYFDRHPELESMRVKD